MSSDEHNTLHLTQYFFTASNLVSNIPSRPATFLRNEENPDEIERGVSIDQDGKSNVWAIEPKMEVSTKSSEEQTSSAIFAAGGFVAFAAVAAGVLTNLPDPDQF